MNKVLTLEQAMKFVDDGQTLMVGGFMANGTPEAFIDYLVAKNVKNLKLICNDTAFVDKGVGKMVVNKQFKTIIASHIGLNKETGRQMGAGETEVILVPQGTLVEQIRAAGFGLGGILTPTGIGTLVEAGKQKIEVDGKMFLLEKPLQADVALLFADVADTEGNLVYKGSENNFNHTMASAAKMTIVLARKVVPNGQLDPNSIYTPSVFINFVVDESKL
jgi:acetate CoA/acetoacetate CoA-transferase alpha subunit